MKAWTQGSGLARTSAGVPVARIEMRKPEFVIGGADANSRRVDLVAAR